MRTTPTTALATALLAVGLALGTSACTTEEPAPQATPSPEDSTPAVTTLRMALTDGFADAQAHELVAAVAQESDGSLDVVVADGYTTDSAQAEPEMLRAVAAGDVDLAYVGVRALPDLGIHDFEALTAPMRLDSLNAQRAFLETDLPDRMLASLDDAGLEGVAIMGGALRHPISTRTPLLEPEDLEGTSFHVWHGEGNVAALEAVGADVDDGPPTQRDSGLADGSIQAFENSVAFHTTHDGPQRYLTVDVALWPAVGVVVGHPGTLADLEPEHRDALRSAAADVSARSVDLIDVAQERVPELCALGRHLVTAGPENVAAFRRAFGSEIERLRERPETAALLDEISDLTADSAPDEALVVPRGCRG